MLRYLALLSLCSAFSPAADWQATAAAGFGRYHPAGFSTTAGNAEAGIGARYVLNAAAGRKIGERFAVEGAWTFQDGDFEIASGGRKTAFDANTHAIHADLIGYLLRPQRKLRPFVVGGVGAKFYHGIEIPGPRPLAEFGSFRDGVDTRPLLTFGGGVEWTLSAHWSVRVDLRDYATPFPNSVIVPAPGGSLTGWLHDFVPVLGVTFR